MSGEQESKFDESNMPICSRLHALALLYAKKGTFGHVCFSAMEGMHRVTAALCFLFGACLSMDGVLLPGTLSYDDFKREGLTCRESPHQDLQDVIEDILSHPEKSSMLNDDILVWASYATNGNLSADEFAFHARSVSRAISQNKRESSTVGPFHKIGTIVEEVILNMQTESISYRPDFSNVKVPQKTVLKVIPAKRLYGQALEKESLAFPYCKKLDTDAMKSYIDNPFTAVNLTNAMNCLAAPPIQSYQSSDDTVDELPTTQHLDLHPPFGVQFQSITDDLGNDKKVDRIMTTEIANSYIFVPIIMHILWAASKNVSEEHILHDAELKTYITFYLKYVADGKDDVTSLETHGALAAVYKKPSPPTIVQKPLHILGATHMIIGMINATLANASDCGEHTIEGRRNAMNRAAAELGSTFISIDAKMSNMTVDDAILALGTLH